MLDVYKYYTNIYCKHRGFSDKYSIQDTDCGFVFI